MITEVVSRSASCLPKNTTFAPAAPTAITSLRDAARTLSRVALRHAADYYFTFSLDKLAITDIIRGIVF